MIHVSYMMYVLIWAPSDDKRIHMDIFYDVNGYHYSDENN